jgi:5-methyltetrahydrofolate--homocysteine methyltransferase
LLVKSAQQMVITAGDLRDAASGAAAGGRRGALGAFTTRKIAPAYQAPTFYAKDAMTGLDLLNEIMDPAAREQVLAAHIFQERCVN